jgi:hypothetical protein
MIKIIEIFIIVIFTQHTLINAKNLYCFFDYYNMH